MKNIYIVKRELRGNSYAEANETAFSSLDSVIAILNKLDIYKDYDCYFEKYEIDKLKDIDNFWKITFEAAQCKQDSKYWYDKVKNNYYKETDIFNVNTPIGNKIFYKINKDLNNVELDVFLYDHPLSLEITSYKKTKEDAFSDAVQKAKKWINENYKKYIDQKTNWLDEKWRWRRLIF